jgi:hypothetical protein
MLTPARKGEVALARLARHQRQHGLAVGAGRPGAGEIVRGDDDGGNAVAGARRALAFVQLLVRGRQRFDPELARAEAAGEVAQQEERLGQHVIARHRFELRDVERRQDVAERQHSGRAVGAAGAGRRHDGVAGVEQHGAAVLHVGVDASKRLRRGLGRAGGDRPVDHREERKLVAGDVEADRLAGLERGALGEIQREALEAGFADAVHLRRRR